MIETFLLGVIATASVTAGVFFLKFWRHTGDFFFLLFATSFLIESLNRIATMFLEHPNEGHPAIYFIRLLSLLLILAAILRKNYGDNS